MENPFSPIFGNAPAHIAGRSGIMNTLKHALEQSHHHPASQAIICGSRGLGKTTLLRSLEDYARNNGWLVANVSTADSMLGEILLQLDNQTAKHIVPSTDHKSFEIQLSDARETLTFRAHLTQLLEKLEPQGMGILLCIDEINPDLPELVELVNTYQHIKNQGKKIALFLAGLPHAVNGLVSGKSTSFMRRAQRFHLTNLTDEEVLDSLNKTVALSGRKIDLDALELASQSISGYPYMLQLVGFYMWGANASAKTITYNDVEKSLSLAYSSFENAVLQDTMRDLTDVELRIVYLVANAGGKMMHRDIAQALGKQSSYVTMYKKRLFERGVLQPYGTHIVELALPLLQVYAPRYIYEYRPDVLETLEELG